MTPYDGVMFSCAVTLLPFPFHPFLSLSSREYHFSRGEASFRNGRTVSMRDLVLFLRLFGKLLVSFMQTIAALNASPYHVKRYLIKHPYEPYGGLIFYDLIKNSSVLKALSFPWLETNIVEIIQLSTTCFLKGITLEQFLRFGMFLNNLEDFSLAMRIYSIAGQAVTQGTATNISPLCFISCFEFISICEGAHRENSFPFYKSKLTYRKYLVNMVVESHSGFFFSMIIVIIVLTSYSHHLITIIRPSRWLGEGGGGRGVWRAGSCGGM